MKKKIKKDDYICITCGQKVPIKILAKNIKKQGMPSLAKLLLSLEKFN